MDERITVSRLKGIQFVFKDDLYELAQFILKVQLAQDTLACKSRASVHLLVHHYASLMLTDGDRFIPIIKAHSLSLQAIVEPDDRAQWSCPA